ncbi:MAG TPA: hypothetical protein DHW82_12725 [Spirochaetia bacterium]|nr:MAG: hypothetical protein A2Y41_03190 [Spirochaetes bacterium GWB1_36_13]HCL57854.1 hypothetical protein [Spirochaetia bacterium]
MKFKLLLLILIIIVNLTNAKSKNGIYSLSSKERNLVYPSICDRFEGPVCQGKFSPEGAYLLLHKYLMNMTYRFKARYSLNIDSPSNTSKEYLDYVFKYYTFEMFLTYFLEIKTKYDSLLKNAPRKDIENVNSVIINLNEDDNYSLKKITRSEVEMVLESLSELNSIKYNISFEELENIENIANLFQTWEDFFINNKPKDMLLVLKTINIKDWLTYKIEYELPANMVKKYKAKLKVFLTNWKIE